MNYRFIAAVLCLGFAGTAAAQVSFDQGGAAPTAGYSFADNKNVPLPGAAVEEAMISRLDTSGCSVQERRQQKGPVVVSAVPIPRSNCWNISDGAIEVEYKWTQLNDSRPQKSNIGFWFSLNKAAQYKKASFYKCETDPQSGYGHDTSGNAYYVCTASALFQFRAYPNLLVFAYDQAGGRNMWDMQVAVSLDDNGTWDSLDGSNYTFRF